MEKSATLPALAAPVPSGGAAPDAQDQVLLRPSTEDLKRRSTRGGLVSLVSQGLKLVLRVGAMMWLARLLTPEDFGLQAMVGAITGFMALFKDAGLSAVTVQRDSITRAQVSTLFWINLVVGACLAVALLVLSPALATFYKESRLREIAAVSGLAFLFNGMAVQHLALLQRQMRFGTLATIEILSLGVSCGVAVVMAMMGYRYWALVGMVLAAPIVTLVGVLIALPWRPGLPHRRCDLGAMLRFGGLLTCNSLVVYIGYNIEKVLLGRFWGAPALGLYGRAYQLVTIPSEQFTSAISAVAFPSLAGLQNEPERLGRAFLKGYALVLALTLPTTVVCAVFAEEIVRVVLGAQWLETVPIFRLLTPTILVLSLINPLAWFLISSGRARRSLNIAFVLSPALIIGVFIGLRFGPQGVALATSATMLLLVVPILVYAKAGSSLAGRELARVILRPMLSGVVAAIAGLAIKFSLGALHPFLILVAGAAAVFLTHFAVLAWVFAQKEFFLDLFRQLLRKKQAAETT